MAVRHVRSLDEGTVFLVPLVADRAPMGVVARRQPRGAVVAVYVFLDAPGGWTERQVGPLPEPSAADFRGRMSDTHIRSGRWPVLGVHPAFARADWPFDAVGHRDAVTGRCKEVRLDDRRPLRMLGIVDVDCDVAARLPGDTIYSPDWLEEDLLPELRVRRTDVDGTAAD
jgi:hypothetical protein